MTETILDFPRPSPQLYNADSSEVSSAVSVLALANRSLPQWRLGAAFGLRPLDRLARMLRLHRLALESELEGVWERADALWRSTQDALRKDWGQTGVWIALAAHAGIPTSEWERVREEVALDLLVATHRALFASYHRPEVMPEHRAFAHVGHAASLLNIAQIGGERLRLLLAPLLEWRIEANRRTRRLPDAADIACSLATRFPEDLQYQDKLAEIRLEQALALLSENADERKSLEEANALRDAIQRVEQHRAQFPVNETFYEVLGVLHRLQAVKLGNAGRLSDALGAIEAARAFYGNDEGTGTLQKQLEEAMHEKKRTAENLQRAVASQANSRLIAEGVMLVFDANAGFKDAEQFRRTKRDTILQHRRDAEEGSFLYRMGVRRPVENKSVVVEALRNGLQSFLADPPDSRESVAEEWRVAVGDAGVLSETDIAAAAAALERRLFGDPDDDWTELSTAFATMPNEQKAGEEPFMLWLFTRRDLGLKVFAAAAVVLFFVALAGGVALRRGAQTQEAMMSRMVAASASNDDEVIRAAESFFAAFALRSDRPREEEAFDLYSRAISRWFRETDDVTTPEATARLRKYKQTFARIEGAEVAQ